MRIGVLLLAVFAAVSWGFGAVLLKRGGDVLSPSIVLAAQYLLGLVFILGWMVARGSLADATVTVGRERATLLPIILLMIVGYIAFVAGVDLAAPRGLPTSIFVAIAASYPGIVALLSGPLLGEQLAWNHALAVVLIIGGVVLALVA